MQLRSKVSVKNSPSTIAIPFPVQLHMRLIPGGKIATSKASFYWGNDMEEVLRASSAYILVLFISSWLKAFYK